MLRTFEWTHHHQLRWWILQESQVTANLPLGTVLDQGQKLYTFNNHYDHCTSLYNVLINFVSNHFSCLCFCVVYGTGVHVSLCFVYILTTLIILTSNYCIHCLWIWQYTCSDSSAPGPSFVYAAGAKVEPARKWNGSWCNPLYNRIAFMVTVLILKFCIDCQPDPTCMDGWSRMVCTCLFCIQIHVLTILLQGTTTHKYL